MGFQKGQPKSGGRKPGSKNKRLSVLEVCESLSLNPFEEMVKIAGAVEHERRFDALKELCQYIEPKRKAIEHSGKIDPAVLEQAEEYARLSNEELRALIREELAKK